MVNNIDSLLEKVSLPLTGNDLKANVHCVKDKRQAIAEGLLYEKTVMLISSDPGCGKSTIATQLAVELASGLPLFGFFETTRPHKVFYIQAERDKIEILERLEQIEKVYPINYDNLSITTAYQTLNLMDERHCQLFLKCIERDAKGAEIIFIDPIYATLRGGLKEDKPASIFTSIMRTIQVMLNCTLWLNHHTTKGKFETDGTPKDDPFYGSQWLKAFCTGAYYLKENSDKDGVDLIKKKDNYKLLADKISLIYNPETELCHFSDYSKLSARDRLLNYIRMKGMLKKPFTFDEIRREILVSQPHLRRLMSDTTILGMLKEEKGNKGKIFYHFIG